MEQQVKSFGENVFENLNPIQKEIPSTEKTIRVITIICTISILYYLYNEFGMIQYMFTDSDAKWDFSNVATFFPLILLAIATILFFKKRKIGWHLLAIFLCYSLVSAIGFLILAFGLDWPIYSFLISIVILIGLMYSISQDKSSF